MADIKNLAYVIVMANWQFSFFLVPDSWAKLQTEDLWKFCGEDGWDLGNAWSEEKCSKNLLQELDKIFPRVESWSENLEMWKSKSHDSDIQAWQEFGALCELQMRLDMRATIRPDIESIVDLAQKNNLRFFIFHNAQICPPTTDRLVNHAMSSRAAKAFHLSNF